MTKNIIGNTVKRYIAQEIEIDPERIRGTATLDDLGVDSIGVATIQMGLQEVYRFPTPDGEFYANCTVDELTRYITDNRRNDETPIVW